MVVMLARPTTLAELMGDESHLILVGDVLDQLRRLPSNSVQVVVTSPPYLGLRDYGLPASVWGGDSSCGHRWGDRLRVANYNWQERSSEAWAGGHQRNAMAQRTAICINCGAWYGCLGQEPTVELFIAHLVLTFEEVRRVLRPDGVLFVNIADSYAGSGKGPTGQTGLQNAERRQGFTGVGPKHQSGRENGVIPTILGRRKGRGIRGGDGYGLRDPYGFPGLKPKDLMLVPERFAIAMQQAGWWVRSHIAWIKPTAMPESVDDRPTSAWESVRVFTKSRRYFWDKIGSRQLDVAGHRSGNGFTGRQGGSRSTTRSGGLGSADEWRPGGGANLRNVWQLGPEPSTYDFCGPCDRFFIGPERRESEVSIEVTANGKARWKPIGRVCPGCGGFASNWVAHFAAFPSTLPRLAILAATSEHGACVACGAPWKRRVDRQYANPGNRTTNGPKNRGRKHQTGGSAEYAVRLEALTTTLGWEPSCRCQTTDVDPCVVLDIFLGSGTTSVAAKHLGRRAIGIELSPSYAALARHRIARDVPKWARPEKTARAARPVRELAAPAQMALLEVG